MKRQTAIVFYLLGIYVVLQFAWWGYHLIELTEELRNNPNQTSKRVLMIIGEGLVFFIILLFGLWKVRSSIKKELQLSKRQNNFLLSITHELKTPIAANKLYLQTLQKRTLDDEKRDELTQRAILENDRLEGMIDNILNASRLENNALKPIKQRDDLSNTINQITERFQKRNSNIEIKKTIEKNVIFSFDHFIVETILNNLIDNAIKYSSSEGIIEVFLEKDSEKVRFGVRDNGPGISKEDREQMFNKFYRSGNEDVRSQKGSGLGLYLVSELVRLHQGKIIYLENTPKGAIFEIIL